MDRPPSPVSPEISPLRGVPTNLSHSPQSHMNRSETSVSTFPGTPTEYRSEASVSTIIEIKRHPQLPASYRGDLNNQRTTRDDPRWSDHRKSDGHGVEIVRYKPPDGRIVYHSESVLPSSDSATDGSIRGRRVTEGSYNSMSTFRPINGDVDALVMASKPGGSPVWKHHSNEHQRRSLRSSRAESQSSVSSRNSQFSLQNVTWEASKTNLFGITEL